MKGPYLFKLAGIEFTVYRLIMTIFFIVATIWAIKSYYSKIDAMKESAYTKAKVTYLENSKGTRLSLNPVINYSYTVKGISYHGYQSGVDNYSPKVGDCIQIKYSENDPNVSEINFLKGIISCD